MLSKAQLDTVVKNNTMLNDNKLSFLISGINHIVENKIVGDIVECGVWMGGSDALLANMLLEYKDERIFRLFDSFDDPHEPLPLDGPWVLGKLGGMARAKGRLQTIKGFYKKQTKIGPGNAKHVYNLLTNIIGYPREKIKIYKGWVQNTMVPYSKKIDKIALLTLDCDLYEPMKICIENLYIKMVNNSVIVIDDYSPLPGCKKAIDDYLEGKKINNKSKIINGTSFEEYVCLTGGSVWIKKI